MVALKAGLMVALKVECLAELSVALSVDKMAAWMAEMMVV